MSTHGDWARRPSDSLPVMYIDPELALTKPATAKVYDYWRKCCAGGLMPARKSINPRDMKAFIGRVSLIEIRPKGQNVDYFVRLAGSQIEEVMGHITGRYFGEFLPPEVEARWRLVCDEIRRTGKPLRVAGRVAFQGKNWLQMEVFVGPLSDEKGEISMFLAGFETWPAVPGGSGEGPA